MRRTASLLAFVTALVALTTASPAVAGLVTPPPQCGGYQAILDYFELVTVFSGGGLSVSTCKQLCKKTGGECKSNIASADSCSRKAMSKARGRDIAYVCKPLEGQEEEDCKASYSSYYDGYGQQYKGDAQLAKQQCDAIRDACLSDCED